MTKHCIKLSTLRRLRGGPAEPFLDGFVKSLLAQGYGSDTRESYLCATCPGADAAGGSAVATSACRMSRSAENAPERPRMSADTCGCLMPRMSPARAWVSPRCLMRRRSGV